MNAQHGQYLVSEVPKPGVWVVRFILSEYHEVIYDYEPVTSSSLYKELDELALVRLGENETLILNLGLVERFPSRLYSLLLAVREFVNERKAHLVLCRPTPVIREAFDLFRAWDKFKVEEKESKAVYDAAK